MLGWASSRLLTPKNNKIFSKKWNILSLRIIFIIYLTNSCSEVYFDLVQSWWKEDELMKKTTLFKFHWIVLPQINVKKCWIFPRLNNILAALILFVAYLCCVFSISTHQKIKSLLAERRKCVLWEALSPMANQKSPPLLLYSVKRVEVG